jgi:hypothetical protein
MTTSLEALVQRCEAEQLHLSGAIQSFGALIRIDTASGCITHVSTNFADIVGVEARAVLGRSRECLSWLSGHIFDNNALSVARRGIYNQAAMAEMTPEYAAAYFVPSGNGFEPTKELRDSVTFARQDITVDPPFLRLDLVTCRNVMIYFNNDLQAKVLSILRYSLRDDGLLFLGRSETVSQQEALFASVDRRARIFLRALADHSEPAMLIDAGCRILHSHGAVSRFINFPSGAPEMNLAQLIVPRSWRFSA